MLSWIKQLFTLSGSAGGRRIDFHEDDYCQQEMLPIANWSYVSSQVEEIHCLSKSGSDSFGFDSTFIRKDGTVKVLDLKITEAQFEIIIGKYFPEYDSVTTGYSSHIEVLNDTKAYGYDNGFVIFIRSNKDKIVTNIWFNSRIILDEEVGLVLKLFNDISRISAFLFVDWTLSVMFNINDCKAISTYLEEYRVDCYIQTVDQKHYKELDQMSMQSEHTIADIEHVLQYIFSSNRLLANKVVNIIRYILTKQSIKNYWFRLQNANYFTEISNKIITKDDFRELSFFAPQCSVFLYGLASLSYDEYIREQALKRLSTLARYEALPYVLLRLNDRALEVRAVAVKVLEEILPYIPVIYFVQHGVLIENLTRTNANLIDVQQKILQRVSHPDNREKLFTVIQHGSHEERFFCWKIFENEIVQDSILLDMVLRDPYPAIRKWAVRRLSRNVKLKDMVRLLCVDKAVEERYIVLFQSAMCNDLRVVREYARSVLRSLGVDNLTVLYQRKITQEPCESKAGIIEGLIETLNKEQVPLIKSYIHHKSAKIRVTALLKLHALKTAGIDNIYMDGLQDNNSRVRWTSISILKFGNYHLIEQLIELLKCSGNTKTQQAVLIVLVQYRGLHSLHAILFALTQDNETLQKLAFRFFRYWYNNSTRVLPAIKHDNEECDSIIQLLEKLKIIKIQNNYFSSGVWDELGQLINGCRK